MESIESFSEIVLHMYSSSKKSDTAVGKKTFKISYLVLYASTCIFIFVLLFINNFSNKYFFYHVAVN